MTDEQAARLEECRAAGYSCANLWYRNPRTKKRIVPQLCGYIMCGLPCRNPRRKDDAVAGSTDDDQSAADR